MKKKELVELNKSLAELLAEEFKEVLRLSLENQRLKEELNSRITPNYPSTPYWPIMPWENSPFVYTATTTHATGDWDNGANGEEE